MTRKSGGHGLHTIQLTSPTIHVADDAHPFVRRPRGEVGAYRCVTCGERIGAAGHQKVVTRPNTRIGVGVNSGVCRDCGGACDRRAARCASCSRLRKRTGWNKHDAILRARSEASA